MEGRAGAIGAAGRAGGHRRRHISVRAARDGRLQLPERALVEHVGAVKSTVHAAIAELIAAGSLARDGVVSSQRTQASSMRDARAFCGRRQAPSIASLRQVRSPWTRVGLLRAAAPLDFGTTLVAFCATAFERTLQLPPSRSGRNLLLEGL